MMRKLLSQAGFTMIELLVVIAVLGILAAAVLSAINPIEQINKGRDTGHRSDAEQLLSAVDRYFALHERYPWNDSQYNTRLNGVTEEIDEILPNGTNCVDTAYQAGHFCLVPGAATETAPTNSTSCPNDVTSVWLCALTDTAEVKPAFADRLRAAGTGNQLYLYKPTGDTSSLKVCFRPQSNGFKKEAFDNCQSECTASGAVTPGACPGSCTGNVYSASGTAGDQEMICL